MNEFMKLYVTSHVTVDIDAVWKAREIEQDARNRRNLNKLLPRQYLNAP